MKVAANDVTRWREAWEGKRYPFCECDLSLCKTDRCTRQIARCSSRVARFCGNRKVTEVRRA